MVDKTPAPPAVWDYQGLLAFCKDMEDTILVTIDLEGVDHLQTPRGMPAPSNYAKLSEVGIVTYDPRDNMKASSSTPNDVDHLAAHMKAYHTIINQFAKYTEETCPASYHKKFANKPGCQHHARPYHCAFARSTFNTAQKALEQIRDIITELSGQNRTLDEVESATDRRVCIFFWAAHMEETTLYQAGIDLTTAGSRVMIWDLQIWSVFQVRFGKEQTKGEDAFRSLGALGGGINLHNATNDCVAELLSLLKILSMKESEWDSWFNQYVDLPPISMTWVNESIYRDNFAMRPRSLRAHTGPSQGNRAYRSNVQGRQHSNMQATTTKSNMQPTTTKCNMKPTTTKSNIQATTTKCNMKPTTTKSNIQATTSKSNTQATTSKSHAQAATSTKPAHAMDFRNGSAKGQNGEKTKGEENVANSEVSQWWNGYDKKKVSSVMSKYRKPTIAAASKNEEVGSGWPADMHWPY